MRYILIILLSFTFAFNSVVYSQNNATQDSTTIVSAKIHSPQTATIMSAVLPGLGQIYNRKIWKAPIIYVGIGAFAYFAISNQTQFNSLKQAYIDRSNGLSDPYAGILSDQGIINEMDRYRRYRDLTILGGLVIYILQIVDANVDAHLYSFDVSDDLSLRIEPTIVSDPFMQSSVNGVKFSLKF